MAAKRGTPNVVMFVVGLAMALLAAGLTVFTEIESGPAISLGIIGIVFIATSGTRPLDR